MTEPLVVTLAAAEALSVSPRTVRRLLERGDLGQVKIECAERVFAASLRTYVDGTTAQSANPDGARPDVREKGTCRESARTRTRMGATVGTIRAARKAPKPERASAWRQSSFIGYSPDGTCGR